MEKERVAFLFDNDGVLIDSSALHWRSWLLLMEEDPELVMDWQMFTQSFGKRNDLVLKEIVPSADPEKREKWAQKKEEFFRQSARGTIDLLPGIELFLQEIQKANIPHIIASSTPIANLQMYITSTVMGKYFDQFVSAEEVAHGKPAPDVFIEAAHRLGFEPHECIVLEDAPAGIQAGKAAGCFVVALETSHKKEDLSGYDMVFSSPKELDLQKILAEFKRWSSTH